MEAVIMVVKVEDLESEVVRDVKVVMAIVDI